MIKVVLSLGLFSLFVYAFSQRRKSWVVSITIAAISLLGVVLVMFPDLTSWAAHLLGVGRGADLVLYCFVLITFVAIFNLHLKLRASLETTTALARALAIATADAPSQKAAASRPKGTE